MKKWHKAKTSEELIGLLHCGFDVVDEEEKKRLISFYLKVAAGYRSKEHLASLLPEAKAKEFDGTRHLSDTPYITKRWMVAQKAWKMLCDKLFKNTDKEHSPSWLRFVCNAKVFADLLWFFRAPEWSSGETNLPHWRGDENHQDTVARIFLKHFIRLVWRGCESYPDYFERYWTYLDREAFLEETSVMFRDARPSTIDLLVYLNWENLLLSNDFRGPIEGLDPACWQRIKEFALRKNRGIRGEPCPTVENALVEGSTMAGVLILLEARHKETIRLKEIKA